MHGLTLMTSRNGNEVPTHMTTKFNLMKRCKALHTALYTAGYTALGTAVRAAMIAFSQLRGSACRKMGGVMKPGKARFDSIDSLLRRKGWAG